jgi:L-rhamnose isomerase
VSTLEAVVEDLKLLSPAKLEEVAVYISRLKLDIGAAERQRALDRAFGSLSESEAQSMASAIETHCERIDVGNW